MIITFTLLGYEIWTLEADFGEQTPAPVPQTLVNRGIRAVSRSWVSRMVPK